MSRHITSAAALSAASLLLVSPFAVHAICPAYPSSATTPQPVPDFEAGGSVRATEVSIKTDMAHDARLSTARSTRASAAAIAPAWSESGPNAVVIVPASVSGSEPACASDTFGAPMTAQALQQARSQLDATQARIAQLRQLRSQRDAAKGLSINATGGTQSRREGGNLEAGTQALHVERLDLNVGGDYRLNDQWAFGGGAGAGHSRMTWDGNTSRLNGDSGNLSAYAVYSPSSASFISAAYSLESTHYGLQTDDGFLHKATGVSQGVSLSAGYDLQRGSWTFSPYLRADDISARIGSFGSEQGGTRGRTGSVTAGAQVQTSVPTSWGVVAPHARLELTQITGWHIQGSSAAVYVAGNSVLPAPNPLDIDRQFGLMGLGASAIMQRGLSLFADYDSGFGQKAVSSWRLTFGLRSEL